MPIGVGLREEKPASGEAEQDHSHGTSRHTEPSYSNRAPIDTHFTVEQSTGEIRAAALQAVGRYLISLAIRDGECPFGPWRGIGASGGAGEIRSQRCFAGKALKGSRLIYT